MYREPKFGLFVSTFNSIYLFEGSIKSVVYKEAFSSLVILRNCIVTNTKNIIIYNQKLTNVLNIELITNN